jgi:fucose permease
MTVQGIGAALSPALGGWIAETMGFGPMFLILGSFAFGSIALWVFHAGLLRPACVAPGSAPMAH